MSDIEQRLDRLEKAIGATGTNIHEYDSAEQAAAYAKQLEAEAKDEAKQQAAAEQATAAPEPDVAPEPVVETEKGGN